MLISGVLLIFDFAQVSIVKINLLGTELLVGRPEIVFSIAWILWAYFLLLYYQYLRLEQDLEICSSFKSHLYEQADKYSKLSPQRGKSGEVYNDFSLNRSGMLKWNYVLHYHDPVEGESKEAINKEIPFRHMLLLTLKSFFYVSFNTAKITDHVLPILLAFSAPIVSLLF